MTHCQFLCHVLKSNGLTNQNDVVELDWLFQKNFFFKWPISWQKIIITWKVVALHYFVKVQIIIIHDYIIFKVFQIIKILKKIAKTLVIVILRSFWAFHIHYLFIWNLFKCSHNTLENYYINTRFFKNINLIYHLIAWKINY